MPFKSDPRVSDIYYVYPRYSNVSFTGISKAHIAELKGKIKLQEIDEEALDNIQWVRKRNILLHPILYVTIGDRAELFKQRQKRLRSLLKVKEVLGGFETADSDEISPSAVTTLNKLDLIMLPSQFAMDVFKNSGVTSPLCLVPHGLSKTMIDPTKEITSTKIQQILALKEKNNATLCLYFFLHSDYRKGADIVLDTFEFLQRMFTDLYLVIKKSNADSEIYQRFRKLRLIEVPGWLDENELRQLYDVCDMLIVPSRGGGFELNALEGIARGIPTLVPDAGCFKDYIQHCVPLPISANPQLFKDNPIHTGNGWEVSSADLGRTIRLIHEAPDRFKEEAQKGASVVRETYSWKVLGEKLYQILKNYGFVLAE